jgi:hypothetical protein
MLPGRKMIRVVYPLLRRYAERLLTPKALTSGGVGARRVISI